MFCSPMLSSAKHNINLSTISTSSSSPSSSSSTSSSTSTSSSQSQAQNMSQVNMEEVWKEINLGSIHHHRKLNIEHEPMFQDFLKQQQPPQPSSSSALYISPLPIPETVLSLNPNSINTHLKESTRFGCLGKKRSQDSDENIGERRHKRMIKNRESAARSRARKQAYTNELELEIAQLQKENTRLKSQEEQNVVKNGGNNSTSSKENTSKDINSSILREKSATTFGFILGKFKVFLMNQR